MESVLLTRSGNDWFNYRNPSDSSAWFSKIEGNSGLPSKLQRIYRDFELSRSLRSLASSG